MWPDTFSWDSYFYAKLRNDEDLLADRFGKRGRLTDKRCRNDVCVCLGRWTRCRRRWNPKAGTGTAQRRVFKDSQVTAFTGWSQILTCWSWWSLSPPPGANLIEFILTIPILNHAIQTLSLFFLGIASLYLTIVTFTLAILCFSVFFPLPRSNKIKQGKCYSFPFNKLFISQFWLLIF